MMKRTSIHHARTLFATPSMLVALDDLNRSLERLAPKANNGIRKLGHGHTPRESGGGVAVRHIGDKLERELACIQNATESSVIGPFENLLHRNACFENLLKKSR